MNAEIIAVGTELVIGQTVDTNSTFISRRLAEIGISVYHHVHVGDNRERLKQAVQTAAQRANIVILTGGLGPTLDDLTKEVVAEVIQQPLVLDERSMERIERFFAKRQSRMSENNRRQAIVIEGATILPNRIGLAPGMAVAHDNVHYLLLPGPPWECEPMFEQEGIGYLLSISPEKQTIYSETMCFIGIGESQLENDLMDLITSQSDPTIAPYAKDGEVTIRVTSLAPTLEEARQKVQHYVSLIADRLPAHFYGLAPTTIAQAVIDRLKEQQATLSTCESFTGGSIASLITQVPGSSNAFNGGLVTYTNAIKQIVAGVSGETIQSFGAVSENTVKEMAENTRRKLGSDYALATSGVAGPETQEGKPVGHLYIALATPGKTEIFAYHMSGTRQQIIKRASKEALYLLWKHLKKGS